MRATGGRAHGVEAAAAPPPRPVGGARRGAGRGGVRGGGAAARRRRVPLLPVAAARRRRRRRRARRPAPEPAVPGTLPTIPASVHEWSNCVGRRFRPAPSLDAGSCPSLPPFCFSEQLNKPAEVARSVIGAVDFAVPVSEEFRVWFMNPFKVAGGN